MKLATIKVRIDRGHLASAVVRSICEECLQKASDGLVTLLATRLRPNSNSSFKGQIWGEGGAPMV